MERHIAELNAAQRGMGIRVTELFNSGRPAGAAVQVFPGRRLDQVRPNILRSALFYAAAAASRFNFSDNEVRVVHVHGDWPSFCFGSMFGRFIGAKVIAASLHSTTHAPLKRYAWALRQCDPVFTTGARQAAQLAPLLKRRIIHLPSAPAQVFFEAHSPAIPPIDVVAVGSLLPVKNMQLLLECAARRPHLKFAIVGTGPELGALQHNARRLGLRNLEFRGAVAPTEVPKILRSARIFINTSLTEGSPTAALEAMACELPVVLTPSNDFGAIVEQGINGRVVSGWNPDELARAIDEFLNEPQRLTRARKAARQTAELHRWELKARIVTNELLRALENHELEQ
jgi:glycosyltransferase involved in cell wall biosynthesis